MNTAPSTSPMAMNDAPGFFARAEAWLDARGKGAWIAAMVISFILFWPIGLALLAYMIWSKRMFNSSCNSMSRRHRHAMTKTSGNSAFDAYKAETLRRLEEEQDNFEAFLKRLRDAKDKAEFDEFMEERAKMNQVDDAEPGTGPATA
ncbi:MAG: DUF2852 domain-containing protein [Pseudomonadota bacterium]